MGKQFITTASVETFEGMTGAIELNTDPRGFYIFNDVSMRSLGQLIEEYIEKRRAIAWHESVEHKVREGIVAMFHRKHYTKTSATYYSIEGALGALGIATATELFELGRQTPVVDQVALVRGIKDRSAEAFSRLVLSPRDELGDAFLRGAYAQAKSVADFFEALAATVIWARGHWKEQKSAQPNTSPHGQRALEFLGMANADRFILFPFIPSGSDLFEHRILTHGHNVARWFNPHYRREAHDVLTFACDLPKTRTTHGRIVSLMNRVMGASTFRTIAQSDRAFFSRWMELTQSRRNKKGMLLDSQDRTAFNALIKVFNGSVPAALAIKPLSRAFTQVSLKAYASFDWLRQEAPELATWAAAFEQFVEHSGDTQGDERRALCRDLGRFLVSLGSSAPREPSQFHRSLVNDFTESGNTFRNFLLRAGLGRSAMNRRFATLSSLFDMFQTWTQLQGIELSDRQRRFVTPVDMRLDRVKEATKSGGTTRKAIPSLLLELMREILVEDNYAWSKKATPNAWGHFLDSETSSLEYVWCPSTAILLFTLLSVPLRGGQARLLDSGVGDAVVFNSSKWAMVQQPSPEPVNGVIARGRREGLLQLSPSGMVGVPEVLGIWVGTNKTSDSGYFIPWISEELLEHIEYQRRWLLRYTQHPKPHGVTAAQGYRHVPVEWQSKEKVFFPLFRDAAATNSDPTLPVLPGKLRRLWGALCLEAQERLARDGHDHVSLVEPGTEGDRYPTARYDIHTLRVSGITDLLDRGVPLNIVSEYVAGHATYIMTLYYDKPSPASIRNELLKARSAVGDRSGALPSFSDEELQKLKPHLISNPGYSNCYTGFDALNDHPGLVLIRSSGICPGTRCEEGGLDENGRAAPVPMGDRGPSCPQCRFWLTGPAFVLGQAIEGNRLILKIRKKVAGLDTVRRSILDAQDRVDLRLVHVLQAEADIEERQLNDMLTEWWSRIRFFEASVSMLDDYRKKTSGAKGPITAPALITGASEHEVRFGFSKATNLELKHFVSTASEIFPEFSVGESNAPQDIEVAVGHFLAINDENDLTSHFFRLDDKQRRCAANLTVDVLLHALGGDDAEALLKGDLPLASLPHVRNDLSRLFAHSQGKSFRVATEVSQEVTGSW